MTHTNSQLPGQDGPFRHLIERALNVKVDDNEARKADVVNSEPTRYKNVSGGAHSGVEPLAISNTPSALESQTPQPSSKSKTGGQ